MGIQSYSKEQMFEIIRSAISQECYVPAETITMQTDLMNDLDVDSLDILNAGFRLERELGVTLPVQRWFAEHNSGAAPDAGRFKVSALCTFLMAERATPPPAD